LGSCPSWVGLSLGTLVPNGTSEVRFFPPWYLSCTEVIFADLSSLLVGSPVETLFGVPCWFWYFGVVVVASVSFLVQPVLVPVCHSMLCFHWFDLCGL
jgi:hypothetical protein